ncbi:hypothetical protein MRB53_037127 [Persea americana]|nr:hypothetical protein MRB53_037127 [Persea americana]
MQTAQPLFLRARSCTLSRPLAAPRMASRRSREASKYLQEALDVNQADVAAIEGVLAEIMPSAAHLMCDSFGNYVMQKLFEQGTEEQRTRLFAQMRGEIVHMAKNKHGCRPLQKALEKVTTEQRLAIARELRGHEDDCSFNVNGNHVIQKVIELLDASQLGSVDAAVLGRAQAFAQDQFACRVLSVLLRKNTAAKTQILKELRRVLVDLCLHQYGNYVVQGLMRECTAEDRNMMIDVVTANVYRFSKDKFASNVVETAILTGNAGQRRAILNCWAHRETLLDLVPDQFGNYVFSEAASIHEVHD